VASLLGDVLSGVGAEVVLDAWRNGSDGATDPDAVVVLLWSAAWGRTSMEPRPPGALVPVRLDGHHPCRPSLDGLRHVRLAQSRGCMSDEAAAMIMHLGSSITVPAPGVRGKIAENTLTVSDFGPLGLFAACPRCDVSSDLLRPYVTVDHSP